MNKDKLPPIELYRKYLNIASIRFNLTIDQCRDKYGIYTIAQWDELFKSDKTEMELAIDWWDAKTPAEQNEVIEQNGGETNITRLYFLEHPELKEVDILEENKRLKEVNKLLVDALQPFAKLAYECLNNSNLNKNQDVYAYNNATITMGNLRDVEIALKEANK